MIKREVTKTLLGGAALSLVLAATPLQAQSTDVNADPTVDSAANGTELTAEELEMAAEKLEAEAEEAAMAVKEGAEEMGEKIEEGAEEAVAVVADAVDDDEVAAKLQNDIGMHPTLGVYTLDVTEIDGRYSVNGMIDKSEDYTTLEQMIADVEGVDPSMIDNNVVLN